MVSILRPCVPDSRPVGIRLIFFGMTAIWIKKAIDFSKIGDQRLYPVPAGIQVAVS